MSNSRGRCFRNRRRTALRHARQRAAFAAFRLKFPTLAPLTRLGNTLTPRYEFLSPVGKQRLIEGYRRGFVDEPAAAG